MEYLPEWQVQEVKKVGKVVMYSTSWCGYCKKAKNYFEANKIAYIEKDIEEWAISDSTIDKYKERYKEEWRSKLDEVVKRMMEKIDVKIYSPRFNNKSVI